MELKQKTEVEINQEVDEPILNMPTTNVRDIKGLFKTVSTAPTRTPRSIYEKIQTYRSGTTYRLYWYSTGDNAWHFIPASGLAGTKTYYVSDSSGGAVTRKLTFIDGILTAET